MAFGLLLLIIFLALVRFIVGRALFQMNKVSDDEWAYQLAMYHTGFQDFLRGHHRREWDFYKSKGAGRQKTDALVAYYHRGYDDAQTQQKNYALTQLASPSLRDLFEERFTSLQDLLLNAP